MEHAYIDDVAVRVQEQPAESQPTRKKIVADVVVVIKLENCKQKRYNGLLDLGSTSTLIEETIVAQYSLSQKVSNVQ